MPSSSPKLVPIRRRLAEEEPEADDSDEPWPGPYEGLNPENARAFHRWTYTLANFDAIAEDREEKVKVKGSSDQLNTDLNERLHTVFKEVRIDAVDKNTVGLLPILRDDVLDRYRDLIPVMADETGATPSLAVPPTSPAVLWTTNGTR